VLAAAALAGLGGRGNGEALASLSALAERATGRAERTRPTAARFTLSGYARPSLQADSEHEDGSSLSDCFRRAGPPGRLEVDAGRPSCGDRAARSLPQNAARCGTDSEGPMIPRAADAVISRSAPGSARDAHSGHPRHT
jgi:hypothetical protein